MQIARVEQRQADAGLLRRPHDRGAHRVRVVIKATAGCVVQVVELADHSDAGKDHLAKHRSRHPQIRLRVEPLGERIHLLAPRPERARAGLRPPAQGALERMRVRVRKPGHQVVHELPAVVHREVEDVVNSVLVVARIAVRVGLLDEDGLEGDLQLRRWLGARDPAREEAHAVLHPLRQRRDCDRQPVPLDLHRLADAAAVTLVDRPEEQTARTGRLRRPHEGAHELAVDLAGQGLVIEARC